MIEKYDKEIAQSAFSNMHRDNHYFIVVYHFSLPDGLIGMLSQYLGWFLKVNLFMINYHNRKQLGCLDSIDFLCCF